MSARAPKRKLDTYDYDAEVFEDIKAELRGYNVDWVSDHAGVSKAAIYFWLDGTTRQPRLSTIVKVAKALGYRVVLAKIKGRGGLRIVK